MSRQELARVNREAVLDQERLQRGREEQIHVDEEMSQQEQARLNCEVALEQESELLL